MADKTGTLLVQKGLVTEDQVQQALERSTRTGEFLGETLVKMGVLEENKLYEVLSEQSGIPLVSLKDKAVEASVLQKIPPKLIWHYRVFPVEIQNNHMKVAVSNPWMLWPLEELSLQLRMEINPVLASPTDIQEAIRKHYGLGAETIESLVGKQKTSDRETSEILEEKSEDIEKQADAASVIKLVNQILKEAIEHGATDIHIEPFQNELSVRYRVDGILQPAKVPEDIKFLYNAIISRIKVMAALNIMEKRLPQDGRARVHIADKEWDLRISILPTVYGENLVIRILPSSMLFSLERLGLLPGDMRKLGELIQRPHGIVFVTGPTGSGKTTTLYACLNRLNVPQNKIITVEDPVEYNLRGISQIQVNPKIGLTFARALRNMLRHDPDVMMVGEVRDLETAEVAVQVALTGHLVFSTLHTNDSAGGVTRLIDMGVEPFLVASSVIAFIAQRLVRMTCPECRKAHNRPEAVEEIVKRLRILGIQIPDTDLDAKIYQGEGCKECNTTGFRGRTAIYELLPVTESIQALVLKKAAAHEIKKEAVRLGMRPLIQDAWEKVKQGQTTVEEALRVTQLEE